MENTGNGVTTEVVMQWVACDIVDDENHRMNHCIKWKDINMYGTEHEINFDAVYTNEIDTLKQISGLIQSIWNLENNKNEMKL